MNGKQLEADDPEEVENEPNVFDTECWEEEQGRDGEQEAETEEIIIIMTNLEVIRGQERMYC